MAEADFYKKKNRPRPQVKFMCFSTEITGEYFRRREVKKMYEMYHPDAVTTGQDAYLSPSTFTSPAARWNPQAGVGSNSSVPVIQSVAAAAPASVIQENPSIYEAALRDSRSTALENSYLSQSFAQNQMDFQAASQLAAQEFNSREAAKNRNWQEYMSNTAHQREVRDLLAAGLNPILSAMGGNGATTGSGATASSQAMSGASGSVDTSGNQAVASLVGAALTADASMENTKVNAIANLAIAEEQRKMNRELQYAAFENAKKVANISADASRYGSDMSKIVAEIYSAATMYAAQKSAGAILGSAGINAASAQAINAANIANERYMASNYPSNLWSGIYSTFSDFAKSGEGSGWGNNFTNALFKMFGFGS